MRLMQSRKENPTKVIRFGFNPNDTAFLCELSDFARNFLPFLG
jgi:hypothetical protein